MFSTCLALTIVFVILAALLTILGDKGTLLIGGFNTFPESEKKLYDKSKIVKGTRNSLLLWALILGIGALLSYFVSEYLGIISLITWIVVFFKAFQWDAKKAFEKYKK